MSIPCGDIYAPTWCSNRDHAPTMGKQRVDADTEKYACIIPAPKTGTVSKVYVVAETINTAPGAAYDVRVETVSAGEPSGTLWDTNTNGALTIGASDDDKWLEVTLTAGASVTRGTDKLAIVLVPPASPDNGSIDWAGFADNSVGIPYSLFYGGASWTRISTFAPLVQLEYSDTTIPKIPNVAPWSKTTGLFSLYSDSATPYNASRFKLKTGAEIAGLWFVGRMNSDDATATLYEGNSTVRRTTTVYKYRSGDVGGFDAQYAGLFSEPYSASADTLYRMSIKNNYPGSLFLDMYVYYLAIAPTALTSKLWNYVTYAGFFSELYRSESADLSSWTDYTDDFLCVGPIIRSIT